MDINEFAQEVLRQQRARLAARFSEWQAEREQVRVVPGLVYDKVDLGYEGGWRGSLMVEVRTGNIYGIKAYGKVHKGHCYGTLSTVDEWDWSEYYPVRRAVTGA